MAEVKELGSNYYEVTVTLPDGGEGKMYFRREGDKVYWIKTNGEEVLAFSITPAGKVYDPDEIVKEQLERLEVKRWEEVTKIEGYSADTLNIEKEREFILYLPGLEENGKYLTFSRLNGERVSGEEVKGAPTKEVKREQPTKVTRRRATPTKRTASTKTTKAKTPKKAKGKAFTYEVKMQYEEVSRFFGLKKERKTNVYVTFHTDKGDITYSFKPVGGANILGVKDVGNGVVRIDLELPPLYIGGKERAAYAYFYPNGEVKVYDEQGKEMRTAYLKQETSYTAAPEGSIPVSKGKVDPNMFKENPDYQRLATPGRIAVVR